MTKEKRLKEIVSYLKIITNIIDSNRESNKLQTAFDRIDDVIKMTAYESDIFISFNLGRKNLDFINKLREMKLNFELGDRFHNELRYLIQEYLSFINIVIGKVKKENAFYISR